MKVYYLNLPVQALPTAAFLCSPLDTKADKNLATFADSPDYQFPATYHGNSLTARHLE